MNDSRDLFNQAWDELPDDLKQIILPSHRIAAYWAWDTLDAIHKEREQKLEQQRDELLAALKEAKQAIHTFHGPKFWEIYDTQSPEMQRINSAITNAERSKV